MDAFYPRVYLLPMALNLKSPDVNRLVVEVAELAGETKTQAVRRALQERKALLLRKGQEQAPRRDLLTFLKREVWPHIPKRERGKRIGKRRWEHILGYGKDGI